MRLGARLRNRWCAFAIISSLVGCGDDGPGTPGTPTSAQDQIQTSIGQLAEFRAGAGREPAAQLVGSRALADILGGLSLPTATYALPQPPGASRAVRELLRKLEGPQRRIVQTEFGTYDRDLANTTGTFPGWTLADPGNPSDGFVFRFGLDDDITVNDPIGVPVPVRGEFRFLHLEIDDRGTPDPADDLPASVVLEIAATADENGSVPVLVRLDLAATFDTAGELVSFQLGNPAANDPSDAGAAYLGSILLAVSVEAAAGSANLLVQLYDSVEDFVVRFELAMVADLESGLTQSASVGLGFGSTRSPTSPPWEISLSADNFRYIEGIEIADITGSIRHNNSVLATLAGDTTEIPIDTDGDEVFDSSCANVNVTFADAPTEPQNLCLALPALVDLLDNQGSMPKIGASHSWLRR